MLKCREITRLLSEARERELTLAEKTTLKLHVMMCSPCRNFGKQIDLLGQISRSYVKNPGQDPVKKQDDNDGGSSNRR